MSCSCLYHLYFDILQYAGKPRVWNCYTKYPIFRQKVLNFWEFSGLVIIFLLIALGYGTLHGYTFYPFDPDLNIGSYVYIINNEFWMDSEGRLPTYVAADLVRFNF